jgi:hypothetical protein
MRMFQHGGTTEFALGDMAMTWRVDTIDLFSLTGFVALGVVLLTCAPLP